MEKKIIPLKSADCPAIGCGKRLLKSGSFSDQAGYYWCEQHKKRGWLMNYGVEHKYPELHFGKFAMGDGKDEELYKIVVVMGREEMIDAAVASLGLTGESDEVA